MRSERSYFLDWARLLAAQTVCVGHMRGAFLPDFKAAGECPIWFSGLAFVSGFGGWAVIVFFVISGWQVGGQLLGRSFTSREFVGYAIDRCARFACVLVPLILATRGLYSIGWLPVPPDSVSLRTAVVNLLSLQTLLGPQYGGNFPLWSLANEWCYYFCAPLLVLAVSSRRLDLLLLCGAIVAAYLTVVDLGFLSGGILWTLAAYFGKAPRPQRGAAIAAVAFIVVIVGARVLRLDDNGPAEFVVGLLFLNCAVNLRDARTKLDWLTAYQPYSFSLYVVHAPIIAVLKASGLSISLSYAGLATFSLMFVGLNAVAFAFYWLFERHYRSIRTWLRATFTSEAAVGSVAQGQ